MTRRMVQGVLVALLLMVAGSPAFAQSSQIRHERRPAALPQGPLPLAQPGPEYVYFSILDGTPRLLELHHDTEVGTISRSMFICSRSSCK
jgi:hypothetical protein